MIEKSYYTVNSIENINLLLEHIAECEYLAIDTETTGLNTRKAQIIGWSVSGEEGVGFYLPTLVYNPSTEQLEEQFIAGKSAHEISKKILSSLVGRKLVGHNMAFDTSIIKNYYGIDLTDSIWVDTMLLVHTVNEEGAFGYGNAFGLKPIAIMHQKDLRLDIEGAANQEQINLKESIKANGGSVTQTNFEIYKADLHYLSEYGAADTDLTLRICNLYLRKLKEENLERFFFEEEVMPIYREVTIPMERYGVDLDIPLIQQTKEDILRDLDINKKAVVDSLIATEEGKRWVLDRALEAFPPKPKSSWGQELIRRYSLPLSKSEKTGKYQINKQNIKKLQEENTDPRLSPIISYFETEDISLIDPEESVRISLSLWKQENDGEYLNIQSKKHLGEIVFKYFGEKALTQTEKGADQFDMDTIEHLSKKYEWAENLRVYNKLLKIKSTYVDRFLEGSEDGRYYPYFKQHGTVSGRYGSDLQQLPKPKEDGEDVPIIVHYNNLVRAFFIAGEGKLFIDDDFESLEPHCVDPRGIVSINGRVMELDNAQEGDYIETIDGPKKILKKWYSEKEAFRIRHRKGELIASRDHKFYVVGRGWVKVSDLKVGDILKECPPAEIPFEDISAEIQEIVAIGVRRLVDITVEGNEEFIYNGIRTHNCFASVSGDKNLQEIFEKGWDFYSTVAIKTEKLDRRKDLYPDGVSPDKKAPNYLKKLDTPKRNKAKSYSLGVAYGMQAYALGKTLGVSNKEASALIEGYLDGFPQLREWMDRSRKQIHEHGFITNYVGRKRHLPIAKLIYEQYGDQFMDFKFRQQLESRHGAEFVNRLYMDYKNARNNCLNFQLQSLAASVVNRAALAINRKAKEMGINAVVQAQIHDQLIIGVEEGRAEEFAPIVQYLMEHTTELPGITLKAPPAIAHNFRDGH